MFILFGFRRRSARLGAVFAMCQFCHTPAAQQVIRTRRYFTLFFVPVIPLGSSYHTTCTMCGRSGRVTAEAAQHLVTTAQRQGVGQPGPVPLSESLVPGAPAAPAPVIDASVVEPNPPDQPG